MILYPLDQLGESTDPTEDAAELKELKTLFIQCCITGKKIKVK